MKYELAKQLKEAGFPVKIQIWEKPIPIENLEDLKPGDIFHVEGETEEEIIFPTLSELIEACGDRFLSITRRGDHWIALGNLNDATGSTPEEAVAKLWLALHETS